MGTPAIVLGDRIVGTCPNHLYPSASGTAPAGPQPFSAPLMAGLASNVFIGGKSAAVVGAWGTNTPPHGGIVDAPFAAPNMQIGRVLSGSATVLIGGLPAATLSSQVTCCAVPGTLVPSVGNVVIG